MDRRSSFSAIFKNTATPATPAAPISAPPPSGTLAPYTGPWTVREAGHLMRRATFGPSQDMIQEAINLGIQGSVDMLLTNEVDLPDPPIKYDLDNPHPNPQVSRFIPYSMDPDVKYGETWINAPIIVNTGNPTNDARINNGRITSAYYWMYYLINQDTFSIREKMTMFWHNHFVVSDFRAPKMIYSYVKIFHENVLGDFRQMTKYITIDPSMLLYLNGAENTSAAPNENYARELLELFTVGKGDIVGPGDYTTFTEDDVREIAKVLTGWTIDPTSIQTNNIEPLFNIFAHDFNAKNLSHRFNNARINFAGEDEYKNVIDVIFESPHVGTHLARKLYRYYVHYNITPEVESSIIEPLAQILRENDYVVEPAIRALLASEHFYGEEAIGCMIKNPTDFYASFVKGFGMQFDGKASFLQLLDIFLDGPILDYLNSGILFNMAAEAGMGVFFHPTVAGWKAYYQTPQYYRTWINTVTLPIRAEHSTALVNGLQTTVGNATYNFNQTVPVLDFAANIPNAQDPNQLIHGIADRLFPYGVTDKQKDFLKEVLIPGLPDFEWTVEYSDYLANPNDTQLKDAVENRLRALFTIMLQMPESQLM